MSLLKHFNKLRNYRQISTKNKFVVHLDQNTTEDLENESIKPRHHAGVDKAKCITVPESIVKAMVKSLKDTPAKAVWNDGLVLNRYLRARHVPSEAHDIIEKRNQLEQYVEDQMDVELNTLDREEQKRVKKQNASKVDKLLLQRTYSWKPIEYDSYKAFQYMLGRSAQDYSTVLRVFSEIAARNANFRPRSYFDFGSGVGTGIWAASHLWKRSIYEYYMVDASREMNDLADLLLRDGDENKEIALRNVNFRQFLPASYDLKYDVVLSAYTLLELPDAKTRLTTLQTLWNKCDRYLVIIEQGTRAGFKLVNEARDFILYLTKGDRNASVFAPCAHDLACPRFTANDGTPCNFLSPYVPLPFSNSVVQKYELYSYVVLEKRRSDVAAESDAPQPWPRLVRPTLVRSKHSICRMCTNKGKLEEIIFTQAQHGKLAYRCARSSRWGDRLPIEMMEAKVEDETAENSCDSK